MYLRFVYAESNFRIDVVLTHSRKAVRRAVQGGGGEQVIPHANSMLDCGCSLEYRRGRKAEKAIASRIISCRKM